MVQDRRRNARTKPKVAGGKEIMEKCGSLFRGEDKKHRKQRLKKRMTDWNKGGEIAGRSRDHSRGHL
jgi:hypothetical protein